MLPHEVLEVRMGYDEEGEPSREGAEGGGEGVR